VLEQWSFGGSQLVLVLEWFLTRSFTVVDSVIEALTWLRLRLSGSQHQLVMPFPLTGTASAKNCRQERQIVNSISIVPCRIASSAILVAFLVAE
jgi:hypothetical protein